MTAEIGEFETNMSTPGLKELVQLLYSRVPLKKEITIPI